MCILSKPVDYYNYIKVKRLQFEQWHQQGMIVTDLLKPDNHATTFGSHSFPLTMQHFRHISLLRIVSKFSFYILRN